MGMPGMEGAGRGGNIWEKGLVGETGLWQWLGLGMASDGFRNGK